MSLSAGDKMGSHKLATSMAGIWEHRKDFVYSESCAKVSYSKYPYSNYTLVSFYDILYVLKSHRQLYICIYLFSFLASWVPSDLCQDIVSALEFCLSLPLSIFLSFSLCLSVSLSWCL